MSDLNEWIKERRRIHNEATEGPWYKTPNDRILSESVQWPEGDDYDVAGGLGRDGAAVEAIHDFDGNAIADAHNTLPAALTMIEKVLELHTETVHGECAICFECTYDDGYEVDYSPFDYPCPTVRAVQSAIEGAINE